MTIYIDVVLIENLLMNYIILLAAGTILRKKVKQIRLLTSSLIGAIYAIITYVITIKIYSNFIFKILLSIIMIYIAFNPQNVKQMWKQIIVFYLTSFIFGGAAFALIYVVKPQEILMKNGLFLGTYPLKTVIISAGVAFILILITFKIVKNKVTKKDMFRQINIVIEGKKITVTSMLDTGNMLREPITGRPVIVVEHTCLYDLVPKQILNSIEQILAGNFKDIPDDIKNKYITKLKFIPFSSLGKQNGMLLGIKPSYIEIIDDDHLEKLTDVIVGIYHKSLTKDGNYRALMGIEVA